MRLLALLVVCCCTLAACDQSPTFDASSVVAYQKSLSEVNARLSPSDRHKLQVALMTLAAGSTADYTEFALANSPIVTRFEMLSGVANAPQFLARMQPIIQGKTAAYVIRRVADELTAQIATTEQQANGAEKAMAAFVIEHIQFHWDRGKVNGPTVEFSIYNGSKYPIGGILVNGELMTAGHDTPLIVNDLNYRFKIPLQPGAQENVLMNFMVQGPWTTKQLRNEYDPDVKLKLSNVEDADYRPVLEVGIGRLDIMRKKRDLLRSGT